VDPHRSKRDSEASAALVLNRTPRSSPGEKTRDPYAIWISEIMLQQTQVATVIPYYQRFLKSFPTVHRLAKSDLSRVLKIWEGLGYYSRARNLHRASKIILNHFKGKIPDHLTDLLNLPWNRKVYRRRHPLHRLQQGGAHSGWQRKESPFAAFLSVSKDPKKTEGLSMENLGVLIPKGGPTLFNQALMDLGP